MNQPAEQTPIHAAATPGGDAPAAPELPVGGELLLWAVACGLKPARGWHHAIQMNTAAVRQLAAGHEKTLARYRLFHAIGEILDQQHLALMLRARLAEQILTATSGKELAEAVRVFEKLPGGAKPAGGTSMAATAGVPLAGSGDELAGMDLDTAIAEARRLLTELDPAAAPSSASGSTAEEN